MATEGPRFVPPVDRPTEQQLKHQRKNVERANIIQVPALREVNVRGQTCLADEIAGDGESGADGGVVLNQGRLAIAYSLSVLLYDDLHLLRRSPAVTRTVCKDSYLLARVGDLVAALREKTQSGFAAWSLGPLQQARS